MVLGDEIPPEVADRILAGLVFRTSYASVQTAAEASNVYYWVFGIDITGAFVISAYYAVKLGLAGQYLFNRYTLFRLDRNLSTGALTVTVGQDDWGDLVGGPDISLRGNVDVYGGLTNYGRRVAVQRGTVNIAIPAVNTTYIQAVTFDVPFDTVPSIVASPPDHGTGHSSGERGRPDSQRL
jgi:hypothetical protein